MATQLITLLPWVFSKKPDIGGMAGAFLGIQKKRGANRSGKKPPKDNMPLILGILMLITIAVLLFIIIDVE